MRNFELIVGNKYICKNGNLAKVLGFEARFGDKPYIVEIGSYGNCEILRCGEDGKFNQSYDSVDIMEEYNIPEVKAGNTYKTEEGKDVLIVAKTDKLLYGCIGINERDNLVTYTKYGKFISGNESIEDLILRRGFR